MKAQYTGPDITKMMSQHKITIRDLAKQMKITLKRVREVRAHGVHGDCMALDWYEAISGTGLFQQGDRQNPEKPDTSFNAAGVRFSLFGRHGNATRITTDLGTQRDTGYNKGLVDALESFVLALHANGVIMQKGVQQAIEDATTSVIHHLDELPGPAAAAMVKAASLGNTQHPPLSH